MLTFVKGVSISCGQVLKFLLYGPEEDELDAITIVFVYFEFSD